MNAPKIESLTIGQLSTLRHSLGLDEWGRIHTNRNHFVTDKDSQDGLICESLVSRKLMESYGPDEIFGGMTHYRVTNRGKAAVQQHSKMLPQ